MTRFFLAALIALCTAYPLAAAEPLKTEPPKAEAPKAEAPKEPDISSVLFMQNLRNIGARIFYMGEQLGLHGWFVVKDKQVQILYTTPDNRALLVGALLSAEGANLSQQQVLTLASNNPEVQALIKDTSDKPEDGAKAGEAKADGGAPAKAEDSPAEQFYAALLKAGGHTLGKDGAPLVIMIMDMNCPFCHQTWKLLEPKVEAGTIRLRMVPINGTGGASQELAAAWLNSKDPHADWKKHVSGGDKVFSEKAATADKQTAVFETTEMVKKWGVDQTPYMLYRGKGGKMRLVVGKPHNVDAILGDIEHAK